MVTCSFIPGGVAAAKGFTAAGVHCGIRKNKSKARPRADFSGLPVQCSRRLHAELGVRRASHRDEAELGGWQSARRGVQQRHCKHLQCRWR